MSETAAIDTHAGAYWSHPTFELVAAVDPVPGHLSEFQDRWGVARCYESLEALLEHESLDVMSICSPDEFHSSQAVQALASNAPPRCLLIEKPVCLERAELAEMMGVAGSSGAVALVNHTRRYDPVHRELSQRVRSGEFGVAVGVWGIYSGGWLHNGVHLIDTLRMFLEGEPVVTHVVRRIVERPGDPSLDVDFDWNGIPVRIESADGRRYELLELDLRFETGRISIADFGKRIEVYRKDRDMSGDPILAPEPGWQRRGLERPMVRAIDHIGRILCGEAGQADMGTDLSEAGATMHILWDAVDHERQAPSGVHRAPST